MYFLYPSSRNWYVGRQHLQMVFTFKLIIGRKLVYESSFFTHIAMLCNQCLIYCPFWFIIYLLHNIHCLWTEAILLWLLFSTYWCILHCYWKWFVYDSEFLFVFIQISLNLVFLWNAEYGIKYTFVAFKNISLLGQQVFPRVYQLCIEEVT